MQIEFWFQTCGRVEARWGRKKLRLVEGANGIIVLHNKELKFCVQDMQKKWYLRRHVCNGKRHCAKGKLFWLKAPSTNGVLVMLSALCEGLSPRTWYNLGTKMLLIRAATFKKKKLFRFLWPTEVIHLFSCSFLFFLLLLVLSCPFLCNHVRADCKGHAMNVIMLGWIRSKSTKS